MYKHVFALIFLVLLTAFGGFGQTKTKLNKATRLADKYSYNLAIKEFRKVILKDPTNEKAIMGLAESYRQMNNSVEAENYYRLVTGMSASKPIDKYYYGQQLMKNGKIDEARKQFEKYIKEEPEGPLGAVMLESCDKYPDLMKDSSLYKVALCDVSTPEADFGPSFYLGNVIFASARTRDNETFNWTGRSFLDLYSAEYTGEPNLTEAKKVTDVVNSKFHEAITTYSPEGDEMYFTRNNYTRGKVGKDQDGVILLKTYKAQMINGKWKKVEELRFNSDEYSVGHPCLTPDGKYLYFVSDMPGGEGGTDIYVSERGKYDWLKPRNLGPEINTPGNEMFPTVTRDGTLYFSSNGKFGLGGLDIYRAIPDPTYGAIGWESIENMGMPLNSSQDDFGLIMDENRGIGFFTSSRFGGPGDDDIYSVLLKHVLDGKVIDAKTMEPIEGAKVIVYQSKGKGETDTDEEGVFNYGLFKDRDYFVQVTKDGYQKEENAIFNKGVAL